VAKILITGGAGNIGGNLADALSRDGEHSVLIVDNLQTGALEKLPDSTRRNWRFIKADVNVYEDIAAAMLSFEPEFVFHYAALVGVKRTLANPVAVLRDIEGIRNVLNISKNIGVRRIFFSSSSEVYGEPVELPQNEVTTPLNSRLPYAIVKNVGEAFLRSYKQEYGLDYTIFRFFNTYGPRQSEDFVISRFIHAALEGRDLTIYGDGSQTRTFCYIDDNIEATIGAMSQGLYVNDVMNVGSDEEISILKLAELVLEVTGSSSRIVHLPPLPEGDMTRRCPDVSRMRHLLNRPLTPLRSGIEQMMGQLGYTPRPSQRETLALDAHAEHHAQLADAQG
jgi:UDP-glucuronate decarboxylase